MLAILFTGVSAKLHARSFFLRTNPKNVLQPAEGVHVVCAMLDILAPRMGHANLVRAPKLVCVCGWSFLDCYAFLDLQCSIFFIKVTSEGGGANVALKALKMSFRQWVKYFQTLSIISFFHIQWPPLPRDFFQSALINMFSFQQYNGPMAVGCLGDRQTLVLDMAFRWSLAFWIPICACLASLFSLLVALFFTKLPSARLRQLGKMFGFGVMGTIKVSYVMTTFFFAALMQNGFMLMMCRSNPNDKFTVIEYPHLECTTPVWNGYLPVMILYLLFVGVLFLCFGAWTVIQQTNALGSSGLKSRGPWGLISQDFRSTHLYWPLILQTKDILLNVIAAVFGILGDGMLQLVFAGAMNLFYGVEAMLEQPTVSFSNTINETWMSMSIFSLIFMSAATGLQENPSSSGQTNSFQEHGGNE